MRCPECEALVPMGAEFCPQCGTPTNAGLRERRTGAQAHVDLKARRRNIFIIGAAFVFGLVIGGQASDWGGPNIDATDWQRRPAVAQAQTLFDAYRDDEEEADDRFGNRGLVVTGEFVRIVNDGGGNPDLRFKTSDPEAPLGADLLEGSHDEAAQLKPGETVTVSCERMAETGDEHWLQNCSIEEATIAAEAKAAPTPSAEPQQQ